MFTMLFACLHVSPPCFERDGSVVHRDSFGSWASVVIDGVDTWMHAIAHDQDDLCVRPASPTGTEE